MRNTSLFRGALELADTDPYPPERDECPLCGLSALACECADEPELTPGELIARDKWDRLAWAAHYAERDAADHAAEGEGAVA